MPKKEKKTAREKAGLKKPSGTRKFQIGSKELSKTDFKAGARAVKHGVTSGQETPATKEALASRTFKGQKKPIIPKQEEIIKPKQEIIQEPIQEDIPISKKLARQTLIQRDEAGNVLTELPMQDAINAGLVEGITGQEQAGQLVEAGLTAGGIAAGLGAVGGAVEAGAARTLNANKLSKFKNAFPTTTDDIVKYGKDILKQTKGQLGKGKAIYGLGALYGINEFALSPSELATWAAIDNIAGQAAFLTRDIADAVKFSGMSQEEANKSFDRAEESIANSRKFVTRTTILNPKLWANRKILMQTIIEAEARVEL